MAGKKIRKKQLKLHSDHVLKTNNFTISDFMTRHLLGVSQKYGKNPNNQIRASHGLHVLILQDICKTKGIKTDKLYPNIRHTMPVA